MKHEQILEELNLNLNNQLEGTPEEKLYQVIGFLYGGSFDEVYLKLAGNIK